MPRLTTSLWFDGRAEEAADFYCSVFPSSEVLEVMRGPEVGSGERGPAITVAFTLDGHPFVGINGGPQFTFDEAISIVIDCADQAEVDHYWDALSDGGEEGRCGWLKDRFGLSWQVVPSELPSLLGDPDPGRARRAMEAMLTMGRIDVAAIRAAADDVADAGAGAT